MRLLQGQTLYARFQESAKVEPGEAVNICNQLLAGVAALHAGGIIHRDLKPNNVMLETGSSHVSIMDFGLARPQEAENTFFGSVVISPDRQWMAYSEYPSRQLWKSRLDGSERVQLTSSISLMPQWSPDGKWLAYTSFHNVYLVSAAGGAPQKLTPDGIDGVAPSWFPDGKSIAFNNYPYPDKPFRIHVIDLATRRISDMSGADGYYVPSWSPDGKYMVAMAQNPSRMMFYSAQTKKWKDLHTFDVPWGFWVWANDSKSIYMGLVLGNNGIYQLTVPQGEWRQLCRLDGVNDAQAADSFMSLTPDGQPATMSRTGVGQIYSLRWPR